MAAPVKQIVYLQEWFAVSDKIQNSLIKELGWLPQKANRIWHNLQPLRDNEIAEIAAMINAEPFELLMPPERAMKLRAQTGLSEVPRVEARAKTKTTPAAKKPRTGTDG